jgi:hypothetical protein
MNGNTGGNRGPRRAGALAVVAAVALLTAGCGIHISFGDSSASTGSATYRASLAYAQCMRAHGLPNFPDPHPSERFSFSFRIQLTRHRNSPAARANDACKHLLAGGSATAPASG